MSWKLQNFENSFADISALGTRDAAGRKLRCSDLPLRQRHVGPVVTIRRRGGSNFLNRRDQKPKANLQSERATDDHIADEEKSFEQKATRGYPFQKTIAANIESEIHNTK